MPPCCIFSQIRSFYGYGLTTNFIADLTTDSSSDQIVETIIAMAQRLGLQVVAEGVKTREQLDHLKGLGCDICQGYFFSKPLASQEIPALLVNGQGR